MGSRRYILLWHYFMSQKSKGSFLKSKVLKVNQKVVTFLVPGECWSLKNKITSHERDTGHAGLLFLILKLKHNYIISFYFPSLTTPIHAPCSCSPKLVASFSLTVVKYISIICLDYMLLVGIQFQG